MSNIKFAVITTIVATIIFLLCAGIFIIFIISMVGVDRREFYVSPNIYFTGKSREPGVSYFRVRIKGDAPLDDNIPFAFGFNGTEYSFISLTPDDVRRMGGEVDTPDYIDASKEVRHGYLIWDNQNSRDGMVKFNFARGVLTGFSAQWNRSSGCPFSLSTSNGDGIVFPCSEEELRQAFGEPHAVRDLRVH